MLLGFALLLGLGHAVWSTQLRFDQWLGGHLVSRPAWLVDPADAVGLATRDVSTGAVVIVAAAILWSTRRRWAEWLLLSAAGGWVAQTLLKEAFGRERPDWAESAYLPTTASFPSGHATTGIDSWVVLGIILLCAGLGRFAKAVGVVAIALGVLLGPSRLVIGVHWPSDVLAGWLLGAAVACAAAALVLWRSARVS